VGRGGPPAAPTTLRAGERHAQEGVIQAEGGS